MTHDDRAAFVPQMAMLAEVYERQVTEQLAEVYFSMLAPYPIDTVCWAIGEAMRTSKFFPRPSELIDFCQRRRRALAERADVEARARLALPMTPEDLENSRRTAQEWIGRFRDLVGRVADATGMRTPRAMPPAAEPTSADLAEHARRKQEVLDRARAKGFRG